MSRDVALGRTPGASSWCAGFMRIARAIARSSSSPRRPRTLTSAAECRHGFTRPSAVTRMRSQAEQNRWLTARMRPTRPANPGPR